MNILFLSHTFDNGGVEKNNFQLIATFQKIAPDVLNIRVDSLIGGGVFFDPTFCKILMPINIPIQKMRKSKLLLYSIILCFLPVIIWKLKKEIKQFQPDIICTNMWLSDILAALFTKNIRIFSIQHDVVKVGPIIKYLKTKALKRISKVIAISEAVKCFLMEYFRVPENKIETIYHGVDFDKFSASQKENSSDPLVFGTIARLDKIKGHIYILEALKILKQKNITPKYIIVGSGGEENTLRNFVRDNSLDNVCFFNETIDVVPLLKEIDVFVMPSLSEGLGIAVIEAMVARKLLIVSDIQALRELVSSDLTGILVEVGNISKWSAAIEWAICNREKVNEIKNNSYAWIISNKSDFDMTSSANKYLKIILKN